MKFDLNPKVNKLNLFYPQWQGGGPDLATYYGAHELKDLYCRDISFAEVEVSRVEQGPADRQIYEFDQIMVQIEAARDIINTLEPERIFTIGGGCDAGIVAAAYLNELLEGDLTLVWFDAHGDLNTPQSSPSSHFFRQGRPCAAAAAMPNRVCTKIIPALHRL